MINIGIEDAKLQTIKLHVEVVSTKGHDFKKLEYTFKTAADNSTRSEKFPVSGHKIKKIITVKGLEIGFCYKFQIQLVTSNRILIGPYEQRACTSKFLSVQLALTISLCYKWFSLSLFKSAKLFLIFLCYAKHILHSLNKIDPNLSPGVPNV